MGDFNKVKWMMALQELKQLQHNYAFKQRLVTILVTNKIIESPRANPYSILELKSIMTWNKDECLVISWRLLRYCSIQVVEHMTLYHSIWKPNNTPHLVMFGMVGLFLK